MGYYANYEGGIKTRALSADEIKKLDDIVKRAVDDFIFEDCSCETSDDGTCYISVYGDDKYHEDDMYSFMKELQPFALFGEIEYVGEDQSAWRHRFQDGQWYEDEGHVEYEPSDVPLFQEEK